MHAYSNDIQMDNTSQYAIRVEKVKDDYATKQNVNQIQKFPVGKNEVKRTSKRLLIKNLKHFQLNINGSKKVLSKRLEMYESKQAIPNMHEKVIFDFYVVIDYEATCDQNQMNFNSDNQEIIEFPAVLLNGHTGKLEDEFQFYCRPVVNPLLTKYCIALTGITQSDVDKAPLFHEVLASFNRWLHNKKLGSQYSFAIVTDGSKDIGHFLKRQCMLSQIDFPEYCKYWINIRKTFTNFYRTRDLQHLARLTNDTVLNAMIKEIGYDFQGKAHSGLDDARNIAIIAQCLLQDGASLIFNEKITEENVDIKENTKSSFSTAVTKAEFAFIQDTFEPNFPAKKSPNSSNTFDTENGTKTLAKDVLGKSGTNKATAKPPIKIPAISSKAVNEAPSKTKGKKKNLYPTKDAAMIPTKENFKKHPPKCTVEKTSSASTSGENSAKVIPSQAPVRSAPKKIPETSTQNSKNADVLKKELERAKKNLYCKSEFVPFKERTQLKKNIEDLKKLLNEARSKEVRKSSLAQKEEALFTTNDPAVKNNVKLIQASESVSNHSQSVKKKCSEKEENKSKRKVSQQSVVNSTKRNVRVNSPRLSPPDGYEIIENSVSIKTEEERLFFENFENMLSIQKMTQN